MSKDDMLWAGVPPPSSSSGGGSGGGGGGADPIQAQLDALRQSLLTQEQLELEAYDRSQSLLDQALAEKLLSLEEYHGLAESLQKEHQAEMSKIDVWRYGSSLDQATQWLGDMANALEGGNDKMARVAQTFAAVETLLNAWRAFSQTLADPTLPFFAKIPSALAVLAAGMNAVNAVKGMAGGGGGGGGGSASAATTATSGGGSVASQPVSVANISLVGDTFSRDSVESLFAQIQSGLRQGYVINLV
jgi:hypothetical protein